jgi:hypothetical protein
MSVPATVVVPATVDVIAVVPVAGLVVDVRFGSRQGDAFLRAGTTYHTPPGYIVKPDFEGSSV